MKVATWNVDRGSEGTKVITAIRELAEECEVVCLQEVHKTADKTVPEILIPKQQKANGFEIRPHLAAEIEAAVRDTHHVIYAPQMIGCIHDLERSEYPIQYGNMTLISRDVTLLNQETGIVYRKLGDMNDGLPAPKSMITASVIHNDKPLVIGNTHGFWQDGNKTDTPVREQLVQNIIQMLEKQVNVCKGIYPEQIPSVLMMGDFNVISDTDFIRTLSGSQPFRGSGIHLNQKYSRDGILETRTNLYPSDKPYREASHAIASAILRAKLEVRLDVPSDHGQLIVTI
jgi:endonuclease/exonuclease/phosphatase family metal-dependent hydrolase